MLLVFSAGCAVLYPSTAGRVLLERSAPHKPEWIVRVPESEDYFYATGFAAGAESLAEGRKAASLAAVEEIAAYLGLETSTYFHARQTLLVTKILSLIETSANARIRSGRMAELYYEFYRASVARTAPDLYDVYVLFRVPMEELEAERRSIFMERSRAVDRAEEVLERASGESLAQDMVGVIGELAGAYRHLAHLEPSSESIHRIEGRLAEIAAHVFLTLEAPQLSDPQTANQLRLRGQAVLIGPSGSVPLRGLPLIFAFETAARSVNASGVTGEEGLAEVTLALAERPHGIARLRLHPSIFSSVAGSEETGEGLAILLSALRSVSAELPIQISGSAPSARPSLTADQQLAREQHPVQIMFGRQTASPGVQKVPYPLLVRLIAPSRSRLARPPLNIGLVLDTSGSMDAPHKIDYLKKAAMTLVRYLGARDTLSIVTYDTEATVLFASAPFPGRTTLLHVLEMLEADGRTNLSDGIETALRQIRPTVRADSTSRLILLTDGLANEGITDVDGLTRLAAEVRRAGATLSTIGLGSDFDSGLLRRMAEHGGGRYHYAALADELPEILAREVEGLLAQAMGEITIDLDLTPDARVHSTFGYPLHGKEGKYEIPVGSLAEGDSRTLVVELVGSCPEEGPAPMGTATIRYRDWLSGGQWRRVSVDLVLHCSFEHLATRTPDPLVAVYVQLMRALDRLELALSSGDQAIARALLALRSREVPSIRATATALHDRQLLDLLSLFEHGMEELDQWGTKIHHHEAGSEVDIRRDAEYRLYLLRHHDSGHRLIRSEMDAGVPD